MQLDFLDGEMTDQCGQDHPPANPSQSQETKRDFQTKGIYGLSGSISSESLDLQSFLENKLAQRLMKAGLTNSKLTWSRVTTLAGRSLYQLQVSELCIGGKDYGLWSTASARDWKDTGNLNGSLKRKDGKLRLDTLPRQVFHNLGEAGFQSIAQMGNLGLYQLNPRFTLWLMGYPIEWAYCAERVTRLSLKSQQK